MWRIFGLCVLLGLFQYAYSQCNIDNCKNCVGTKCGECEDGYKSINDSTNCCSVGCGVDDNGWPRCNRNTTECTYENCINNQYYGPFCKNCSTAIDNCKACSEHSETGVFHCIECFSGFDVTTSNTECCPPGCDSCNGTICTSCKNGWYLYNDGCDTCGENCKEPADGSSRCDETTGACYLGCEEGFHGSRCNVSCDLARCNNCSYDEPNNNLTCIDCLSGYYDIDCKSCGANCVRNTDPDVCEQNGYCIEGCLPAYRTEKCDVRCNDSFGMENCLECERFNYICTKCIDGFYGPQCQFSCNGNCSPNELGVVTCNIDNGTCSSGCMTRHFKPDCSGLCPNCKNDICQRENGLCTQPECKPGFFGATCNTTCPSGCASNPVSGEVECNFTNGVCLHGCLYNLWRDHCTEPCSQFCNALTDNPTATSEPTCFQSDGECKAACKDNYYLPNCTRECTSTCVNDRCDIMSGICAACDETPKGYLCPDGDCPHTFWGLYCNQSCPEQCLGGGCDRDSGECAECNDGFYNATCNRACPNCQQNKCFQADGDCIYGCADGWYTDMCMMPCLHDGCKECNRNNGECINCKTGKFGQNCSAECSRFCSEDDDEIITCNKVSGACDTGICIAGYWGTDCNNQCSQYCEANSCDINSGICEPCVKGWYGQTCAEQCSDRCKDRNCVTAPTQCRDGCADGYWGISCESNCSVNCNLKACDKDSARCLYGCENNQYYGDLCSESCSSNCVGGVCNRTGYCLSGCNVGYYGDRCDLTCLESSKCVDGTCARVNGTCPDCFTATPGSNCPTAECPSGKRGEGCNLDCTSTNCLYDQCDRYNDICKSCPLTFYGSQCTQSCPNCREGTGCDQTSGACTVGCKDGWYGTLCDTQCRNVCASCERNSGQCITCVAERYGENCESVCSSNCLPVLENGISRIYCEKNTGYCSETACRPGYWHQQCINTCGENCEVNQNGIRSCAILDGECANGCQETYFGVTCIGICSDRCRDKLCQDDEDICTLGCADGYYGARCTQTCSAQCAGAGGCDSVSGTCDDGCKDEYYGDRCLDKCINTCFNDTCDDTGICPDCKLDVVGPQCRVQTCDPGKYGPLCENDCPGSYCVGNRCHRKTGVCSEGCRENYHGVYCTELCNCSSTGTIECEQSTGECVCISTRYGQSCSLPCSDGCQDFACLKDGQCTNGCNKGRYGSMCANTCSNCIDLECSSTTGICNLGCNDGWYGEQCNMQCPANCQTCDQNSGTCQTCRDNYFGLLSDCGETCSSNCASTGSVRQCDQSSGACLVGCRNGYYGSVCADQCGNCADNTCDSTDGRCSAMGCMPGWHGTQCRQPCNENCRRGGNDNQMTCDINSGACDYGCVDGFYGDQCTSSCSINCLGGRCSSADQCTDGCVVGYYGSGCTSACTNCAGGQCNADGDCQSGCNDGFYGTQCSRVCWETCLDNTCDVTEGSCNACRTSPKGTLCRDQDPVVAEQEDDLSTGEILGIAGGCVGIVIIFVIVFVCCITYWRQANDAKNEIHLPSDLVDRLSTHRSLHSTVSTNYPVARVVGDDEKDFVMF